MLALLLTWPLLELQCLLILMFHHLLLCGMHLHGAKLRLFALLLLLLQQRIHRLWLQPPNGDGKQASRLKLRRVSTSNARWCQLQTYTLRRNIVQQIGRCRHGLWIMMLPSSRSRPRLPSRLTNWSRARCTMSSLQMRRLRYKCPLGTPKPCVPSRGDVAVAAAAVDEMEGQETVER